MIFIVDVIVASGALGLFGNNLSCLVLVTEHDLRLVVCGGKVG